MSVHFMPEGYHSITAYLSIQGASDAIEFYKQAFNAEELFRLDMPNGDIGHAEIKIGDSHVMLADPCEETAFGSPKSLGGTSVGLYIYTEDVDSMFTQAINAGAVEIKAVEDQFYGDRSGTLEDPFGYIWFLATHIEDLTPDEINARTAALFGDQST